MMEYKKLLKKAMAQVPEEITTKKRFEIPRAVIFHEGPKTIIRNFKEILTKLRRDERHVSRFLSKQLAAPGNVEGDQLILQGNIPNSKIQQKIEEYVRRHVYCQECGNADTKLLKEDRITYIKCEACGAKHPAR